MSKPKNPIDGEFHVIKESKNTTNNGAKFDYQGFLEYIESSFSYGYFTDSTLSIEDLMELMIQGEIVGINGLPSDNPEEFERQFKAHFKKYPKIAQAFANKKDSQRLIKIIQQILQMQQTQNPQFKKRSFVEDLKRQRGGNEPWKRGRR